MAYSNGFVCSIKVENEYLQEKINGETVIPFNSEYSIYLKNRNNKRAVAKITIDKEYVGAFIIPANDSYIIERFVKTPIKFKFVSLDSTEALNTGKNLDNTDGRYGVIEVNFYFEKYHQEIFLNGISHPFSGGMKRHLVNYPPDKKLWGSSICDIKSYNENPSTTLSVGTTVEGSESTQRFDTMNINLEDSYTTIKLVLVGTNPQEQKPTNLNNSFGVLKDLEDIDKKIKDYSQDIEKLKEKIEGHKRYKKEILDCLSKVLN